MATGWWGISASIVAWAGVIVIFVAMLAPWIVQRVKRRRRCPKCWYDLSHSPPPAMRCSECGYTAKRESKLYKARRRWRFAILGVFMLIGAYALNVTPAVKDRGWPAAVPTTLLIHALPWLEAQNPVWPAPDDPIRQRLFNDLYARHFGYESSLWMWQQRWMLRRAIRTTTWTGRRQDMDAPGFILDRALVVRRFSIPLDEIVVPLLDRHSATLLHVPERWPVDEPLRIRTGPTSLIRGEFHTLRVSPVHEEAEMIPPLHVPQRGLTNAPEFDLRSSLPAGGSGWRSWRDGTLPLFNQAVPHGDLQLKLELIDDVSMPPNPDARVLWSAVHQFNIEWVDDIHDIVTPWTSEEIASAIHSRIRMKRHYTGRGQMRRRIQIPVPAMSGPDTGVILALTLELHREGESMLFGHINTRTEESDLILEIDFTGEREAFRDSGIDPGEWTVVVRGDPRIAIRDFTEGRYWSGEISIPLSRMITH